MINFICSTTVHNFQHSLNILSKFKVQSAYLDSKIFYKRLLHYLQAMEQFFSTLNKWPRLRKVSVIFSSGRVSLFSPIKLKKLMLCFLPIVGVVTIYLSRFLIDRDGEESAKEKIPKYISILKDLRFVSCFRGDGGIFEMK